MRKLLTAIFIVMLLPVTLRAKHADLIGIPIDGTIQKFEKALIKDGYTLTSNAENKQNTGTKFYEGKFLGLPAKLFVYYSPETNLVYKTRAMIPVKTEEAAYKWLDKVAEPLDGYYELSSSVADMAISHHGRGLCMKLQTVFPKVAEIYLTTITKLDGWKYS